MRFAAAQAFGLCFFLWKCDSGLVAVPADGYAATAMRRARANFACNVLAEDGEFWRAATTDELIVDPVSAMTLLLTSR